MLQYTNVKKEASTSSKRIDFLSTMNISSFKIPSGEINNLPYLRHIGKHGKPIILYDPSSVGSNNYMNLVTEILNQNG